MRGLSDLTTLVFLNLITLVCSLPVVTAGAAWTTMNDCIMKMQDGEGHVISLYWKSFLENLKTMTLPWMLMLCMGAFLALDTWIVQRQNQMAFMVPILVMGIVWAALLVWMLPLGAKFVYSIHGLFRNAAILAIGKLPRTLGMMLFLLIPFVLIYNLKFYPILFVLGLSLPAYLCSFLYQSVIQDLVEAQQRKQAS